MTVIYQFHLNRLHIIAALAALQRSNPIKLDYFFQIKKFIFIRIWSYLTLDRRKQYLLLLLLMILSSILEVLSIGAVVPFLGLLSNPEALFIQPNIQKISAFIGIKDADQLLLPLTCLFVVATLFAALVRLLLLYCSNRISFATGTDLSIDIYKRTLYQDYETHISRNSSEIINSIITKTNLVVSKILVPFLNLISSLIIGLGIISVLLYISVYVSVISFFVFGLSYFFLAYKTKKILLRNSSLIARNSDKMVKFLQEGLGGIRDVLVNGTQPYYCKLYSDADTSFRRASADNVFISGKPKIYYGRNWHYFYCYYGI